MHDAMSTDEPLFEAVIVPHRSLSARGLWWLVATICGLSAATSTLFWWLGAWPVMGFSGVEVLAAILLIRHHAQGVRAREQVWLRPDALQLRRTDQRGRSQDWRLSPAWLRVVVQERGEGAPGLYLAARGRRMEIAARLSEAEKRDLAEALRAALHRLHHPRFDNPQLRA